MCGVFAVYKKKGFNGNTKEQILTYINNGKIMEHRGDKYVTRLINNKLFLLHNRISSVNEPTSDIQPMIKNNIMVVLCGRIYNYNELCSIINTNLPSYIFKSKSHSEILIALYLLYGSAFIAELKGMFSFVLYDATKDILISSRDHMGTTSLYYSLNGNNSENIIISSEIKSIISLTNNVNIFNPGQTYLNNAFFTHYNPEWKNSNFNALGEFNYNTINELITNSILDSFKTINKDQAVGVILYGTLESNILIATIMKLKNDNLIQNPIKTFTIGLENSSTTTGISNVDTADKVSKYLNTSHNSYTYDIGDIDDVIEDVIYYLESYNKEVIYNAIPLYLLSMQIQEEYDIPTLISSEILDKLFVYNDNINDTVTNINTLHKQDLCKIHKIPLTNKLEVVLPFSNKELINYCVNIDPKYKKTYADDPDKNIAKYILRNSFTNYLSNELLRTVEDTAEKNTLINGLKAHANNEITDADFDQKNTLYPINTPNDKEEFLYRKLFEIYYKNDSCIEICN